MRALLSVSDKTGLVELAEVLLAAGYELISTGGTYQFLQSAGLEVLEVKDVTGMAEMLGGRVKTLHPKIHGGILARRENQMDVEDLAREQIELIDLVVVNLYPFAGGLSQQKSLSEQVELIDVGGPTMLRSAAKNFAHVLVLSSPSQYREFYGRLKNDQLDLDYRKQLAASVFQTLSAYDGMIADYLSGEQMLTLRYQKVQDLRYGENPDQTASFYRSINHSGNLSDFQLLSGKPLSYSNLADVDAAYGVVCDFDEICVCAVKHNTPCGVALGASVAEAYHKTYEADPISIFGGIVAVNRSVDEETARQMVEIFLEVIVAPGFTPEALEIFKSKPNLRLVKITSSPNQAPLLKSVNGGLLVQSPDSSFSDNFETVTTETVGPEDMADLVFAMKVAKHVKSNAIVVAKNQQTLGIGGGQTNRIDATRLALRGAVPGAVLASDGFFPFDDVVRAASEAGIRAILQPGGSIQDEASIKACDELGLAMVLSGRRHFKH